MLKRLKRVCFLVMTCIFALVTLTACGDRAISNLEIKENTLKYTYEQGETVSFEGLVVIAKYNDDTTEEIKFGDDGLTVSSLSTETKGKKKLTIDYKGTSITVEITVVEPSDTTKLIRKINSLPSVENITLANKNAIVELRATYDGLSDTAKGKITNYSVLQAAEAKIAELELNSYKASKKIEISSYKTSSNYSTKGWAKIQQIIATANAEIDAAASNDGVNAAVTKAKAAMDQIQTSVEELLAYKNAKKQELADYADEKDYSASNWTQVETIITNGTSNINAATSKEAVDQALEDAKASIDEIDTKADELQAYKNAKKQELQNYKNQEDYSEENWVTIQDYISDGCALIDLATTNDLVDRTVSSTKTNINSVKVIAVTNVEDLIDALPTEIQISDKAAIEAARAAYNALSSANRNLVSNREKLEAAEVRYAELDFEGYKTSKKQELDSYVNLENYKDSNKTIITNYINAAKEAIDGAENRTQVDNAVSAAKTNIDSVKVKRITDVEDEIESISIDDLTLSNESKEVVSAARTHYDALDENDRALVGNYAKLQNAEARLAQLQLNKDKEDAKAELNSYKVETNYNSTKWSEIQNIIAEASARIDAATDKANINLIVSNAKANIDNVKTLDITTVEDKIDAIPDASSLSLADESKITEARNAYNALADDTLKGKVGNLAKLQEAETRLAELKLEKAKEDAKLALDTYKDEDNYSPSAWKRILGYIENGKNQINAATTISGVEDALSTAKATIDNEPDKDHEEHDYVIGWEKPTALAARELSQSGSGEAAFVENDHIYIVGDDNPVVFLPNITTNTKQDGRGETKLNVTEYRSKTKVYVKERIEDVFVEITDENKLNTYVDIDEYTFAYDFTEYAIDKYFKFEILPYYNDDSMSPVEIEFKVVDGYNVTNAMELGVMYNYDDNDGDVSVEAWKTLLKNNGIYRPDDVRGIILHNNMSITANDIPSLFLETKNSTTYLKDYVDIYEHVVKSGTRFNFYGNYYTIDATNVPLVDRTTADQGVTHSSLFKINMNECSNGICLNSATTYSTFTDVSFIGNADTDKLKEYDDGFGGLIMGKFKMLNVEFENSIVKSFFINIYGDDDDYHGTLTINNFKSYDAFQNILFVYGGTNVNITNSIMMRCGGPVMLLQHPSPDTNKNSSMPMINIDENTQMESFVIGNESWFTKYGATTTAGLISAMSQVFGENGYVFETEGIKKGKMNLLGVFMSNGYSGGNGAYETQGKLTIGETAVANLMQDGSSILDTSTVNLGNGDTPLRNVYLQGAPVVATKTASGFVNVQMSETSITGMNLIEANGTTDSFKNTDKYITLYQAGMAVVLQYNVNK